jgi:Mannosylglycerate hydrolase MGH1-like glycoside hydrolase domain
LTGSAAAGARGAATAAAAAAAVAAALLAAVPLLATGAADEPAVEALTPPAAGFATPDGFVVAPGRRAAVFGYARDGLEVWAWPLQLIDGYRVDFVPQGGARAIAGSSLLRSVAVFPDRIVRRYVGADFVVDETLIVPLRAAGVLIRFRVGGRDQVGIRVRFRPSLNLIWPAALGGQSTVWDAALGGYVIREPLHGFAATITSPDVEAHDAARNDVRPIGDGFALTLRPHAAASAWRAASLAIDRPPAHAADLAGAVRQLRAAAAAAGGESAAHDRQLLAHSLQVVTPDPDVNAALAWATIALDQAWVCNPTLGCGEVAGYGPSRPARRPQYAWFFAGDGLTAVDAWAAVGDLARAREELEFVLKYQDPQSGMIWHELAQSASYLDWQRDYPYMFVHVDITFQFLSAVDAYERASGDERFLRDHWPQIRAAYRYCLALVDPTTRLPRIPAGKEDVDEQHRLSDSLSLSAGWIDASAAFARLAARTGDARLAATALRANAAARRAVAVRYWDPTVQSWMPGRTVSGEAIKGRWLSGPAGLLGAAVFDAAQTERILDRLASASFQTDWGVRDLADDAPDYDPNLYASGSVWAVGTAGLAEGFWRAHRPAAAFAMWRALIGWSTADAPGHMDEVFAGDFDHPEFESVPAQTWSSAGFLQATVRGLLGLDVDAGARTATFAPYLPPDWPGLGVRHLAVGAARITLALRRDAGRLVLDVTDDGPAIDLDFSPNLPVGARLIDARLDGAPVEARLTQAAQETRAHVALHIAPGRRRCVLRYAGGVSVVPIIDSPQAGDASREPRVVAFRLDGAALRARIDVRADGRPAAAFDLATAWRPIAVDGGSVRTLGPDRYRIYADASAAGDGGDYRRTAVVVHLSVPPAMQEGTHR